MLGDRNFQSNGGTLSSYLEPPSNGFLGHIQSNASSRHRLLVSARSIVPGQLFSGVYRSFQPSSSPVANICNASDPPPSLSLHISVSTLAPPLYDPYSLIDCAPLIPEMSVKLSKDEIKGQSRTKKAGKMLLETVISRGNFVGERKR